MSSFNPQSTSPVTTGCPSCAGRCRGISHIEAASRTLARAVTYLVDQYLAGMSSNAQANREAVSILCTACVELSFACNQLHNKLRI